MQGILWSLAIIGVGRDAKLDKLNLSFGVSNGMQDKSGEQCMSDWIWLGLLRLGSI